MIPKEAVINIGVSSTIYKKDWNKINRHKQKKKTISLSEEKYLHNLRKPSASRETRLVREPHAQRITLARGAERSATDPEIVFVAAMCNDPRRRRQAASENDSDNGGFKVQRLPRKQRTKNGFQNAATWLWVIRCLHCSPNHVTCSLSVHCVNPTCVARKKKCF